MKKEYNWAHLLAYVTGLVNQELLLQSEYLASENRILRGHLPSRLRLSDPERATLAEIGRRLGRKALANAACVAIPIRFWLGIGNWWPRNSMAPSDAPIQAGHESLPTLKRSSCDSHARTKAGATTGSWARWPMLDTVFRIRRSAMFCGATGYLRHPKEAGPRHGRISSARTWRCLRASTFSQSKC